MFHLSFSSFEKFFLTVWFVWCLCTWLFQRYISRWRSPVQRDHTDAECPDLCRDLNWTLAHSSSSTGPVLSPVFAKKDNVVLHLPAVIFWRWKLGGKSIHHLVCRFVLNFEASLVSVNASNVTLDFYADDTIVYCCSSSLTQAVENLQSAFLSLKTHRMN